MRIICIIKFALLVNSCPLLLMCDTSAGSIPKISKYRDTCESSTPIFSGIAILRYFGIERPLFDTFDISISTKSMRRRNIVVDDVVYGSYHYSALQHKLT